MRIEHKILEALEERETDLKNLKQTLDTGAAINENLTSQIMIHQIIIENDETNR
jgi:hypothetical protein